MRAVAVVALASAVLSGCATSVVHPAPRVPVTATLEADCTPDATGRWQRALNFRRGALSERECALRVIAAAGEARSGASQFNDVRRGVGLLHGFYARRAERQQSFMDVGAGITLFSAAAAFEGGISQSARQAWGVAAFSPVALTQFNGNEPTREMFHGGALALQLITTRYDRLDRALSLIATAPTAPDCLAINQLVTDLQTGMMARQPLLREDPAGLVIAEARRLQRDCLNLATNHNVLAQAVRYTDSIRSLLAADYADGVLQLDHALLAKDRDLRYTPAETLSAIVASPLRAADSLLTGENAQAAVNSLKTQVAFSGLNRSLSRVRLPPLPTRLPRVGAVTPAVDALDGSGTPARRAVLSPWLHRLRTQAASLDQTQKQQDFALEMVGEYAAAAGSDYLTFAFDVTTSTTTITLAPRPAAADPLGSATTAQGAPPPIAP
jgi:hypothetical protein